MKKKKETTKRNEPETKTAWQEKAEQSEAIIAAMRAKENKTLKDKWILAIWDITSHIYIPKPLFAIVGICFALFMIVKIFFNDPIMDAKAEGLLVGAAVAVVIDILYWSIYPPKN